VQLELSQKTCERQNGISLNRSHLIKAIWRVSFHTVLIFLVVVYKCTKNEMKMLNDIHKKIPD